MGMYMLKKRDAFFYPKEYGSEYAKPFFIHSRIPDENNFSTMDRNDTHLLMLMKGVQTMSYLFVLKFTNEASGE